MSAGAYLYRLLKEGRRGMPTLYGIATGVYAFLSTGTLFSTTRCVEVSWTLHQLRLFTNGKSKILQLGDVLLRKSLSEHDVELIDIAADEDSGPGLKVHKNDIRDTSLPADYFDVAISISTLEHIGLKGPKFPDGDRLSVDIIHRALKPGGLFLFTVPFGEPAIVLRTTRVYNKERLDFIIGDLFEVVEKNFLVWDRFRWKKVGYQTAERGGLLREKPIWISGLALVKLKKRETNLK